MRFKTVLLQLGVALLVALFWLPAAFSQDDIMQLSIAEPGMAKRPPATFKHDEHAEKAGLDDSCGVCHHEYEDGKMLADGDSSGTPCSDCHAADALTGTNLQKAFHGQCKSCHKQEAKGPVACGECHQK